MGVQGLLPVLKSIQEPTTLERFRGKTLAIDTYAWLHKASFTCAEDLVLEKPTKAYINYFRKKLDMLKHFNITPYFVFDGDYLPSKSGTEKERELRRNEFKKLATEAKRNGNIKLSYSYYQKACDISPEMAKSLINELKIKLIKYVVAPYEADSQMVLLEKLGLVDGIISEDSDLLIFGCKTLITKLDDKAQCIEIKRENFKNIKNSYINGFNDDQLLLMAVISGCDYTKGIPGIGMQKSIQLIKSYKTFERIIMSIKVEGKNIPNQFEEEYKRAKIAFRHQIVFNPIENLAQHLNPLTEEIISNYSKEYIHSCTGFILDQEIHKKISTGELDPFSKNVLISWESKVNPTEVKRSNSQPTISTAFNTSRSLKRATTNLPITRDLEQPPILKKKKIVTRISQFSDIMNSKKRVNNNSNNNSNSNSNSNSNGNNISNKLLSPTAKRQKILEFNKNIPGTISSFFSHKKEINEKIIKDDNFPATSSDIEDITEEDINDINLKLKINKNLSDGSTTNDDDTTTTTNSNIIQGNEESSDISISESEDFNNKNSNNSNNINNNNKDKYDNNLKSESDMEDIIDSSEVSESTITMDKNINISQATPTSLMLLEGSSISSGISTDAGDINTECYIDEDDSGKYNGNENGNNDNRTDDSLEDENLDKSNLLAEIYSFGLQRNSNNNNTNKINNKSNSISSLPSSSSSILFPMNRNIKGNNSNKVHRPSPLHYRTPLRDVTNSSNSNQPNGKKKVSNNKMKPNGSSGRVGLSAFRYIGS